MFSSKQFIEEFSSGCSLNFALVYVQRSLKTKIKRHFNAKKLILTLLYTGHMGNRWYASQHKVVTFGILASVLQ
jgi:hypothetical protein